MIKAIIFDLGGVLFTNGTKKFKKYLIEKYSLRENDVTEVMEGEIGSKYREAKITRDDFWKLVKEKLGLDADINQLETEWINGYELIHGTKEIIFELKKQYKVYYLSDNVRERIDKINTKYDFLRWFEGGIFSHELGVRKPHLDIYKKALEIAEVGPHKAVFIDDKAICLPPAEALGMKTILFLNPHQLLDELKKTEVLNNSFYIS